MATSGDQAYTETSSLFDRQHGQHKSRVTKHVIAAFALCTFLIGFSLYQTFSQDDELSTSFEYSPAWLGQENSGPISHPEITEKNVEGVFKSERFRELSARRLSGAIQIPTEVFNDMGAVGEEERWDIFFDFAKYLRHTFPLLHEKLEFESVNTHGLVYTWEGADSNLEPMLLTGCQGVDPTPEYAERLWKYALFSGHFDNTSTYVYGKGTQGSKNNLVAMLASITALLEAGFVPQRSVVLAFEFDGKSSTNKIGNQIGHHLEEFWGQDWFALVVNAEPGSLEIFRKSEDASVVWRYLSGVINHVFGHEGPKNHAPLAIPQRHAEAKYRHLSENIYRLSPLRSSYYDENRDPDIVDERVSIDAHLESILFYHELIRVFDEVDLEQYRV